jgi:hypothetical protein
MNTAGESAAILGAAFAHAAAHRRRLLKPAVGVFLLFFALHQLLDPALLQAPGGLHGWRQAAAIVGALLALVAIPSYAVLNHRLVMFGPEASVDVRPGFGAVELRYVARLVLIAALAAIAARLAAAALGGAGDIPAALQGALTFAVAAGVVAACSLSLPLTVRGRTQPILSSVTTLTRHVPLAAALALACIVPLWAANKGVFVVGLLWPGGWRWTAASAALALVDLAAFTFLPAILSLLERRVTTDA